MTSQARPAAESPIEPGPADYLRRLGQAGDGPHDLATAALMLAALDFPEQKLAPFRTHLSELAEAARAEVEFARNAENAVRALAAVIAGRYGYDGERVDYDDLQNANLISVIERRRGLPVALGILYIHAARASKMQAAGLFSPGHFLLRVSVKGSEAVLDPFNGGATVDRERISAPRYGAVFHFREPESEDQPDPFTPVSDSEVLLRLQNNIKNRALRAHDTTRAIATLLRMTIIAPRRAELYIELGRLQESMGALSAARGAYENCLKFARAGEDVSNEAALALHALKRRLN